MSEKTLDEILEGIDESDYSVGLYTDNAFKESVLGIIDHLPYDAITVSEDGTYEHNMNVTYVDRLHETGKIEPLRKWFEYKATQGTLYLTKEQLSFPKILLRIVMSQSWRERNQSAFYLDEWYFALVDRRWVHCTENEYYKHEDEDINRRLQANVGLAIKLDKIASSVLGHILWTDQYEPKISWGLVTFSTKSKFSTNTPPRFEKTIKRKNANPE